MRDGWVYFGLDLERRQHLFVGTRRQFARSVRTGSASLRARIFGKMPGDEQTVRDLAPGLRHRTLMEGLPAVLDGLRAEIQPLDPDE